MGLLLLFAALLCCIAPAQDVRGVISGRVADTTGAAVPGALVRAIRAGNRTTSEVHSNHEGFYVLTSLDPGSYTLEAEASGFKKLRETNVTLMVADKLEIPLRLSIGDVKNEVTVYADQGLIRTADASGGANFDSLETQEYALNGRQAYMLMGMAPGVLFTQEEFGATGFSGTRGWDTNGEYVMNGGVKGTNQFLLNGAPVSVTGSWQIAPNMDAIQEFKVMLNVYDAQYGRTGGGTVNTTLKSGANAVHGTLFDYLRNSVLDANVTQNNRVGAPRGKHITNQFGGTLGAPIRKDEDFVFLSFEGFRERVPFPVVRDSPPLDLRDGQNFSAYGISVFDPLTTRVCRKGVDTPTGVGCFGTYIRDQFPNNTIPASRISPVGRKILSLWPAPNYTGQTQNFIASANVGRYRYEQPMGRWDHNFADGGRLYTVVTFQDGSEFRNQNGFAPPVETGNILSRRRQQTYIAGYTRVLSPAAVLDVRASFGRFTSDFPDGQLDNALTPQDLGMRIPAPPTAPGNFAPRINLDLYSSIIGNSYSWNTSNQWNLAPSVTWAKHTHTLKFGFEYALIGLGAGGPGRANGEFTFNRGWTQQYADRGRNQSDGSGVADLLLGLPDVGFADYNDTYYRRWPYWAVYLQDDWKLSPTLTLNLGLRYDVQLPFIEQHDRVNAGFDFNAINPLSDQILANWRQVKQAYDAKNPAMPYPDPPAAIYGGKEFIQPGGSRRTYDIDWTDLQPRIGVAWRFLPNTVLRTGFGIYHRTATQGNLTDGFNQRTSYIRSQDGIGLIPSEGLTGPYSLQDPFPDGLRAPSGSSLGLLTNIGSAIGFDGHQLPIPRTFQYSFGLQPELPWNVLIDASYVGSQTVHDSLSYQMDYIPMGLFQTGHANSNLLNRKVPNPFWGILPMTSDFGGSQDITALNLYRPYPEFNGVSMYTNPWARYRYDALQLRMEKRFRGNRKASGALTLIFSYTFAKSFEANHRLNDWNLAEPPIHELSNYDKPQNIAFSGVWDLPLGEGRRFLSKSHPAVKAAVSDWNFNWVWTYYSGYPVAEPNAQFSCGSYIVDQQTPARWFNNDTSCYRDRAAFTLRDTPDRFGNIRNPAAPQLNITLARTFRIGDRWSLQMRGESFNATNTPLFGGPVTDFKNPRFGMLPLEQRNFPRLVQIAAKLVF